MSDSASKFVWYEWMGPNLETAISFYRHVIGWEIAENTMAGVPYQIASIGKHGVAGMLAPPPGAEGVPPCWTGYVWVSDVDKTLAKLKAAGGKALREPMDIPNVGRMAIVADPQGAPFALFHDDGRTPPPEPPPETAGLIGWRELSAADADTALGFYTELFGWRQVHQFDMGPMGAYRIFDVGGQQGGAMTKGPQTPGPFWLYYFLVESAGAAAARVKDKGGAVLREPEEVPGGMFAVRCADPAGAVFGMVSTKR